MRTIRENLYPIGLGVALTCTTNLCAQTPLDVGLVAHYDFEHGTQDISGMDNDATPATGVTYDEGITGSSASYDYANELFLASAPHSSTLDFTDAFSLSGWIKVTDSWENDNRGMARKSTDDDAEGWGVGIYRTGTGPYVIGAFLHTDEVAGKNTCGLEAGYDELTKWNHLALVYNGALMTLYVNGHIMDSTAVTGQVSNSIDALNLGLGNNGDQGGFLLDEVRLYNRALVAGEIQILGDGPDLDRGLVAHFPCEISMDDASGNGNHAIPSNGVSYKLGMTGQAATYDYSDQVALASAPTAPSLEFGSRFSVSGWIRVLSPWIHDNRGLLRLSADDDSVGWGVGLTRSGTGPYTLGAFLHTDGGAGKQTFSHEISYESLTCWNHIAFIYDGGTAGIYMNGELVDSASVTGNVSNSNYWLELGRGNNLYPGDFILDEIRLYDRALNLDELAVLASGPDSTQGLVAHYACDGNLADISGSGHHASAAIGVSYESGIHSKAVAYDYSNGVLAGSAPHSATLAFGNRFSAGGWIRVSSEWQHDNRGVLRLSTNDDTEGWGIGINRTGTGPYTLGAFLHTDQTVGKINCSFDIDYSILTDWNHVLMVYDGVVVTLFFNGIQVDSVPASGNVVNSISPLQLGRGNNGFVGPFALDDLRVYNRVLAPNEATDLAVHPAIRNGLVAHYEFEHNLQDVSENKNHATPATGVSFQPGTSGTTVLYDYTNEYYLGRANHISEYNFSDTFAASGWIKVQSEWEHDNRGLLRLSANDDANGWGIGINRTNTGPYFIEAFLHTDQTSGKNQCRLDIDYSQLTRWNHLALIYDGVAMTMYLNGIAVDSVAVTGNVENSDSWLELGRGNNSFAGPFLLDELLVHNRALTATELRELASGAPSGSPSPAGQYLLSIEADQGGLVTGRGYHEAGTTVFVTATPKPGYRFHSWEGDGTADPAEASTSILMDGDKSLAARFVVDSTEGYIAWSTVFCRETDISRIGPAGDFDKDKVLNFLEYAFVLDPTSPASLVVTRSVPPVLENTARHGAIQCQVRSDDPQLAYTAMVSQNLVAWETADLVWSGSSWGLVPSDRLEIASSTDHGDGTWSIVIKDKFPLTPSAPSLLRMAVASPF